ncbi:hypothetical protein Hanom_Chr00s011813g01748121 [Helianthus anomalus]
MEYSDITHLSFNSLSTCIQILSHMAHGLRRNLFIYIYLIRFLLKVSLSFLMISGH